VWSWLSLLAGWHWIFRWRQKRHASLARSMGRLRPLLPVLTWARSREVDDVAGASTEDDGRDDNGESGLDTADWSSLADPGKAGWS